MRPNLNESTAAREGTDSDHEPPAPITRIWMPINSPSHTNLVPIPHPSGWTPINVPVRFQQVPKESRPVQTQSYIDVPTPGSALSVFPLAPNNGSPSDATALYYPRRRDHDGMRVPYTESELMVIAQYQASVDLAVRGKTIEAALGDSRAQAATRGDIDIAINTSTEETTSTSPSLQQDPIADRQADPSVHISESSASRQAARSSSGDILAGSVDRLFGPDLLQVYREYTYPAILARLNAGKGAENHLTYAALCKRVICALKREAKAQGRSYGDLRGEYDEARKKNGVRRRDKVKDG